MTQQLIKHLPCRQLPDSFNKHELKALCGFWVVVGICLYWVTAESQRILKSHKWKRNSLS